MKLFEDDGSGDDAVLNEIEVDKDFARRFEHNKKREDLQRLEELKKKGVISESDSEGSSSSEEEEVLLTKGQDKEFFDALIKIRNKDPSLRDKDAKLFDSESESEDENIEEEGRKKKDEKKKPMYLKDVVAKHLIEEGPEFEDKDDGDDVVPEKVKSYDEEQEELKKAFFDAVAEAEGGEDGGEFIRVKSREGEKDDDDDDDSEVNRKMDEYFGDNEKVDGEMTFLKDYFRNRMWVGEGGDKGGELDEEGIRLRFSEDEEEIERQEDFEREYNFRFEEGAGDRVLGHSRVVEGSVRKQTNARKSQRERKLERMAQAEFERKEELKRLKNLKKKELQDKIRKIKEVAGIVEDGDWLLDENDLEKEFDPDDHDKKMDAAFNEEYYEAEDIDPGFGSDKDEDGDQIEKPDFDKEDELLGLPKGWDEMNDIGCGVLSAGRKISNLKSNDGVDDEQAADRNLENEDADDGFLSTRRKILKLKSENRIDDEQEADADLEIEEAKQNKKRKRQIPSEEVKNLIDKVKDEYHKLDYEGTIGDLKTRFKYRTVNPKRYGLSAQDILMMDEKELNQYVPLKKLAPYREKEWKVPRIKVYQLKRQNAERLQGESSKGPKANNKMRGNGDKWESLPEEVNGKTSNQSRRTKRRNRQAELKLSHSRLLAYGKISSKPKSRKKS